MNDEIITLIAIVIPLIAFLSLVVVIFISLFKIRSIIKKQKLPFSVSSNRIDIRYCEQGGYEKEGIIELRKGIPDLSLGENSYAQVRIAIDDKYFIKGMAVYSNTIPYGKDIVYYTKKPKGTSKNDIFKKLDCGNNPFGIPVYQQSPSSAIYIVDDDTDWADWKSSLPSNFLIRENK